MSKRSLESCQSEQVSKKPNDNKFLGTFHVKRNEEYEGSFPVYKQPQEINSYSIDHERHVWFDSREMVTRDTLKSLAETLIFDIRNTIIHQQEKI
jgi:RAT1-interacting protein